MCQLKSCCVHITCIKKKKKKKKKVALINIQHEAQILHPGCIFSAKEYTTVTRSMQFNFYRNFLE